MSTNNLRAKLSAQRQPERELLVGRVRETVQWSPISDEFELIRYDFAYTDPVSGQLQQFMVEVWVERSTPIEMRNERVAEPSVAKLARMIEQKCGIREALAHQYPLSFPIEARARMV
jgi:hypothetical protein